MCSPQYSQEMIELILCAEKYYLLLERVESLNLRKVRFLF